VTSARERLSALREATLADGVHGPVSVSVDLTAQRDLEEYYGIRADYPGQVGAHVAYDGHRDDLVAAGCVSAKLLASGSYKDFNLIGGDEDLSPNRLVRRDRAGTLVSLESKAGPGKRGWLRVVYLTIDRQFAEALPGVRDLYPEGLPRTGPADGDGLLAWQARRPRLRLAVDNTRR